VAAQRQAGAGRRPLAGDGAREVVVAAGAPAAGVEAVLDVLVAGDADAPPTLRVLARDGFWRPIRVDDRPTLTAPVTLDFTPPSLEVVAARQTYTALGEGRVRYESGSFKADLTLDEQGYVVHYPGLADRV